MSNSEKHHQQEFERVALPLNSSLYSTALRLTRDRYEAEDLVQDTYLKAFRFFCRFQRGTNIHAWLLRILTNIFIDKYNQFKRLPIRVNFEKADLFALQLVSGNRDKHDMKAVTNNSRDLFDDSIAEALDKLPVKFRTVVLLRDVHDFQYKEIAETLICPLGTVMSRLSRGRSLLRRHLRGFRGNSI